MAVYIVRLMSDTSQASFTVSSRAAPRARCSRGQPLTRRIGAVRRCERAERAS